MKYRLLSMLCAACDVVASAMTATGKWCLRPVQWLHDWAWRKASRENLITCNLRNPSREIF